MGDDDDGEVLAQLINQLFDLRRGDGVEGGARLIHQQHFWRGGDGAGDAEALLLAAGQAGAGGGEAVFHLIPEGCAG